MDNNEGVETKNDMFASPLETSDAYYNRNELGNIVNPPDTLPWLLLRNDYFQYQLDNLYDYDYHQAYLIQDLHEDNTRNAFKIDSHENQMSLQKDIMNAQQNQLDSIINQYNILSNT